MPLRRSMPKLSPMSITLGFTPRAISPNITAWRTKALESLTKSLENRTGSLGEPDRRERRLGFQFARAAVQAGKW